MASQILSAASSSTLGKFLRDLIANVRPPDKPEDFVFPSERLQGIKPLDLASVLKHSVGTMLAEMGEHQLTIGDYLRHTNLHVTNKYLQATWKTKGLAQNQLVDASLPTGILPKTRLMQ